MDYRLDYQKLVEDYLELGGTKMTKRLPIDTLHFRACGLANRIFSLFPIVAIRTLQSEPHRLLLTKAKSTSSRRRSTILSINITILPQPNHLPTKPIRNNQPLRIKSRIRTQIKRVNRFAAITL
jgi:hypothetical protein